MTEIPPNSDRLYQGLLNRKRYLLEALKDTNKQIATFGFGEPPPEDLPIGLVIMRAKDQPHLPLHRAWDTWQELWYLDYCNRSCYNTCMSSLAARHWMNHVLALIKYLKENHHLTNQEIGQIIGVSSQAISLMVSRDEKRGWFSYAKW